VRPEICVIPLDAVESVLVDDASLRLLCLIASGTLSRSYGGEYGYDNRNHELQERLGYDPQVVEVALERLKLAGHLLEFTDGRYEVVLTRPGDWKMPEFIPAMPGEPIEEIPETVVAEAERPKSPERPERPARRRTGISVGTRYRILKRDNFKCVYCGRNASEVALQIDHYTPVSAGGSNDDPNLRSACYECNAGKGATPP